MQPDSADKPIVTVYMQERCDHCREWTAYLSRLGFRISLGDFADWEAERMQCKVPRAFSIPMTATVNGFCVHGFVPANQIHALLNRRFDQSVSGLLVPGMPHGAPGIAVGLPEPFTVYALLPYGLLRPIAVYNDPLH